jgi:hypothetical protein
MIMQDTQQREKAELVFNGNLGHEAVMDGALAQEAARRAAVLKNMERLRALRLARDQVQRPR